jgi:hypothetical protein
VNLQITALIDYTDNDFNQAMKIQTASEESESLAHVINSSSLSHKSIESTFEKSPRIPVRPSGRLQNLFVSALSIVSGTPRPSQANSSENISTPKASDLSKAGRKRSGSDTDRSLTTEPLSVQAEQANVATTDGKPASNGLKRPLFVHQDIGKPSSAVKSSKGDPYDGPLGHATSPDSHTASTRKRKRSGHETPSEDGAAGAEHDTGSSYSERHNQMQPAAEDGPPLKRLRGRPSQQATRAITLSSGSPTSVTDVQDTGIEPDITTKYQIRYKRARKPAKKQVAENEETGRHDAGPVTQLQGSNPSRRSERNVQRTGQAKDNIRAASPLLGESLEQNGEVAHPNSMYSTSQEDGNSEKITGGENEDEKNTNGLVTGKSQASEVEPPLSIPAVTAGFMDREIQQMQALMDRVGRHKPRDEDEWSAKTKDLKLRTEVGKRIASCLRKIKKLHKDRMQVLGRESKEELKKLALAHNAVEKELSKIDTEVQKLVETTLASTLLIRESWASERGNVLFDMYSIVIPQLVELVQVSVETYHDEGNLETPALKEVYGIIQNLHTLSARCIVQQPKFQPKVGYELRQPTKHLLEPVAHASRLCKAEIERREKAEREASKQQAERQREQAVENRERQLREARITRNLPSQSQSVESRSQVSNTAKHYTSSGTQRSQALPRIQQPPVDDVILAARAENRSRKLLEAAEAAARTAAKISRGERGPLSQEALKALEKANELRETADKVREVYDSLASKLGYQPTQPKGQSAQYRNMARTREVSPPEEIFDRDRESPEYLNYSPVQHPRHGNGRTVEQKTWGRAEWKILVDGLEFETGRVPRCLSVEGKLLNVTQVRIDTHALPQCCPCGNSMTLWKRRLSSARRRKSG